MLGVNSSVSPQAQTLKTELGMILLYQTLYSNSVATMFVCIASHLIVGNCNEKYYQSCLCLFYRLFSMISFPLVLQTCGASVAACVFIDMFGVSDQLQLRPEATPSLEAAKLTLAVCTEKAS